MKCLGFGQMLTRLGVREQALERDMGPTYNGLGYVCVGVGETVLIPDMLLNLYRLINPKQTKCLKATRKRWK